VPHLAARNIATGAELDDLLANLAAGAGVRCVLVIAGDRDRPAGPFASALELIESGLLQRHGITEIGIAGYPEGHPRIATPALERALAAKVEAAGQTGLAVHIVTQFCFDAAAVTDWIVRLRGQGIEHPVRVGMAGPTSLATLLRYAQRCGVRASVQGLARNAGLIKHLVGTSAPDGVIRPLADAGAAGRLGRVAPHFFSFGGVAATARWAAAVRAGRITLGRADGFQVEPP
jgi:methylenetetrahydrofolate reductase (NADPH)